MVGTGRSMGNFLLNTGNSLPVPLDLRKIEFSFPTKFSMIPVHGTYDTGLDLLSKNLLSRGC